MSQINSHCSYCGRKFPAAEPWPRHCHGCRNASYLNPLPVVVILLPIGKGLVVIRRGIEPAKGTLTLPGGYIDLDETWQQAAARELLEETGISISDKEISLYDVANGLDDTLVVFGLAKQQPARPIIPFSATETQEVALIEEPIELGFPNHTDVVHKFFSTAGDL